MTDYGSDFAGVTDLDPQMTALDGASGKSLTQALARRFDCPRRGLFYDQTYGLALSQFVLDIIDPKVAEQAIISEALKDERVARCLCAITPQLDGSWKIQINPQTESGATYSLVFTASATNVTLISSTAVG
jgi:hypothetical protein